MHTKQRLLTIVKSGSIYTLLDRYNYLYFYILNAFYFTFILTFFFHFLQQQWPIKSAFLHLPKTVFVQSLPFPCKIKTFCFYLSVILVGLIYTFFGLSFYLAVLYWNHCSIWVNIFESCWTTKHAPLHTGWS